MKRAGQYFSSSTRFYEDVICKGKQDNPNASELNFATRFLYETDLSFSLRAGRM